MKAEDKELLLKDLCARLPYGVIVKDRNGIHKLTVGNTEFTDLFYSNKCNIKPYLRPMSSMTEEERSYYNDRWFEGYHAKYGDDMVSEPEIPSYIDWLNAHYFDYRNLIERGMAIEVTEENNPYKDKL